MKNFFIQLSDWWKKQITAFQFIIGAGVVIVIMIIYAVVLHNINLDYGISGPFGDQFGAVNTFFSAMAFLGILISLFNSINDRKKDLMEKRNDAFESRFFFLLGILEKNLAESSKKGIEKLDNTIVQANSYHFTLYYKLKGLSKHILENEYSSSSINSLTLNFSKVLHIDSLKNEGIWERYKKNYINSYSNDLVREIWADLFLKLTTEYNSFLSVCNFLNSEFEKRKKSNLYSSEEDILEDLSVYLDLIISVTNRETIALFFYMSADDSKEFISNRFLYFLYLGLDDAFFLHPNHLYNLKELYQKQKW